MDKKQLQEILSQPFQTESWTIVLKDVFGARNILQKPRPIQLSNNKKASAAYELGSFNTSDDRIIGLYLVKVNPEVWLERNKVGLRELLRSIYKYEVDGALVVFEQQDKWRLSFVSEIRTFDEQGHIIKKATEPKRYTYLLGKGEKTKTPTQRLTSIAGKAISLEDIRNSFSVEALNEEFYKIVARHFYQLVGATEGKGAKAVTYDRVLKLPAVKSDSKEGHKIYQEFAVRLIGRTVFCWFLKVKKSETGITLLPEHLLSSASVRANKNYYHFILEKLFFQTLNTPMDERIDDLPNGCEQIPFLNGGLFEPQYDDFYTSNKTTGLSDHINTLKIPDEWFIHFFENLEQYNFTIDENSVVDIEVSIDPEMLGRIFENLLAEIDPDSGETARKATGSFYTPREIVDYMATESLVQYLRIQTKLDRENLHPIFKIDSEVSFPKNETEKILDALDRLKILDPACGSGAFPMGVLQKIVMALQKLDKDAAWWKTRQIKKIENPILRKQVEEKLQQTTVEYARKIGIIQNSLYGVDIQPIAAEISKLRCFLTLVVDENIDETKPNRGVEPLPNLEFKFVTADALLKLPEEKSQTSLFSNQAELDELQEIRLDYLQSYGEHKEELKTRFLKLQKQIFKQQLSFGANEDSRAYKISSWNPFSHDKVDWFDPLWMYGVKEFDIVIGNPPYLRVQGIDPAIKKKYESTYFSAIGSYDLYILFTERGQQVLSENGILNFIQPDKWINGALGKGLRKITAKHIYKLISFKQFQVFNASTYSSLLWITKKKSEKSTYSELDKDLINNAQLQNWLNSLGEKEFTEISNSSLNEDAWLFTKPDAAMILNKINKHNRKATNVFERIFTGLQTSLDDVYFISNCKVEGNYIIGKPKAFEREIKIEKGLVKHLLKGDNVRRYEKLESSTYVIFPYELMNQNGKEVAKPFTPSYIKKNFPNGWNYLIECETQIKNRENGKLSNDQDWYKYLYPKNLNLFNKPRLVCRDICQYSQFSFDSSGDFCQTTTVYGYIKSNAIKEDYKYFLAILNSQITWYFMKNTAAVLANGYYRYMPRYISQLPLPEATSKTELAFIYLTDYLVFLKSLPSNSSINKHVPNSHLVQLFEELIDALVYELYFEEDFKKVGIEFMKYAERDIESIEGKEEKEAVKIIEQTYQKLREKDNEIRNNLLLMDIKLAHLIMPIKTAK